jgi:hypothetical protein
MTRIPFICVQNAEARPAGLCLEDVLELRANIVAS